MRNILSLFRKQPKTRQVVLRDIAPPTDNPNAGAAVMDHLVAIFRPPVTLDEHGHPPIGMTQQLIAQYLVATTSAMAEQNLGPVTVEWGDNVGRFVITGFRVHSWGYNIQILHPVGVISQHLAAAWDLYKDGIALKIQQMHRGHQRYDQANAKIRRALQQIELLRDAQPPHMSPAEYLFLHAAMNTALVLSAAVPVGKGETEPVLGTHAEVTG